MSLGAAKTAFSTSFTPAAYSCFISPNPVFQRTGNGSTTTASILSNVIGGVGPFTYLWEVDNSDITVNTSTSENTSFSAAGFNAEVEGNITLTVTDTGNGNAETTDTSVIVFVFGIQP